MADDNIMSLIQNLLLDDGNFSHAINGGTSFGGVQLDALTSSPSSNGFLFGDSLLSNTQQQQHNSHHNSNHHHHHHHQHLQGTNNNISNGVSSNNHHHHHQPSSLNAHTNGICSQKELMLKSLKDSPKNNSISLTPNVTPNQQSNLFVNGHMNLFNKYGDLTGNDVDQDIETSNGAFFGKSFSSRLLDNHRCNSSSNTTTTNHSHLNEKSFDLMSKKSDDVQLLTKDLPLSPLSDNSLNSLMVNQPLNSNNPNNSTANCVNSFNAFNAAPGSSFASMNNLASHPSNAIGNLNSNNTWQQHSTLPITSQMQSNAFADLLLGCSDVIGQQFTSSSNTISTNSNTNGNIYTVNNNSLNSKSQSGGSSGSTMSSMFTSLPHSSPSPDSFVYTEEDRFESQMRSLTNEIQSTIQLHMNGLHMRREALLQQLEHIKKVYRDVLRKQKHPGNNQQQAMMLIGNNCNGVLSASNCNPNNQTNNGKSLLSTRPDLTKVPLPNINFTKPDTSLYKAISGLGYLNTPAFAPFCKASGEGLEFAVPGVNCCFSIETRNCFNDELHIGRELITVEVLALFADSKDSSSINSSPSSGNGSVNGSPTSVGSGKKRTTSLLEYSSKSVVPHTFFDHNNGKYSVTYVIPMLQHLPSELVISILVNGLAINDSPIRVPVQLQKRQDWKRASMFGSEGNNVGELCRPWGVAIVRMPTQLLSSRATSNSPPGMHHQSNHNDMRLGGSSSDCNSTAMALKNGLSQSTGTLVSNVTMSSVLNTPSGNQMSASSSSPSSVSMTNNVSDHHYLIGVADRSNNRIQMLDYDAKSKQTKVINVFGNGPGNRPGMFDRPAGICINLGLGHIIVADKDNHRIQVFSLTGRYLFKFGEKGNRAGQFCYPWDIDCCQQSHQIVVSDTRNRRIQLFTPYGQYISHFALLLDSPRGVAFLPDKRLVVSDFNKHRILIFDKIGSKEGSNGGSNISGASNNGMSMKLPDQVGYGALGSPKIIGFGEGSQWGEFLRPQGIAVNGNQIFCADSRNNRICVYNMLTQTFEYLCDGLDLDRPSDLAVIDDNLLVVVDFGNNRLQIMQR